MCKATLAIRMTAPLHIQKLIDEIKESKDRWIALYTSTWTYHEYNSQKLENTEFWEQPVSVGLPAREHRDHKYTYRTARDLDNILRSRDGEIALNHVVTLFSLLENLIKEVHKHLYPQASGRVAFSDAGNMIEFLSHKKFRFLLDNKEVKEFVLARQTRNCVLHTHHIMDAKWIEAWEAARPNIPIPQDLAFKDDLYYIIKMPDMENWHDFFLGIVERIEKFFNASTS